MERAQGLRRPRRECQALVAIERCGPGRGLAALRVIDEAGRAAEYFLPFAVNEMPAQLGHEYSYAGLIVALERLRSLEIRRVLVQTDDAAVVAEIERRADPHRDLTLSYIILGCKLNEFSSAKIVAVPADRLSALRAKAAALASTVYQSVA